MTRRMSLVAVFVSSAVLSSRLLLQLGEKARVLDGDHGLVSEGLEQLHEAVLEETGLRPGHDDRTDGGSLALQWHGHHAAYPHGLRERLIAVFGILFDVTDMDHRVIDDRAHRQEPSMRVHRELPPKLREECLGNVVRPGELDELAVVPIDGAERGATESHRAPKDRVEDRLQRRRRAGDEPQDFRGRCSLLQRLAQDPPEVRV